MKKILIIFISLILIISNAYADKCYDSDTTPIILDSDKKLGRFFEDQPDVNDDFQVHIVYTLIKDSKDKEGDINGDVEKWIEIADNFRILQGGEIKENIIPWILENKPKISPEINNRIEMAMKITTDEINKAQNFREKLKVEIDKSLPKEIIALFPTTPFSSLKCGQSDEQLASYRKKLMEFTSIAGMTSRPQISMPKFKDNTGPIGISLLGWQYSDEILLEKLMYL